MKNRLKILLKYFLFWLFFFLVMKLFFLFYNRNFSQDLLFSDYLAIFYHGLPLDVSISSYILLLPSLFTAIMVFFKSEILTVFFKIYTIFVLLVVSVLSLFDIALYEHWGFRLDISPFSYIDDFESFTASVSVLQIAFSFFLTAFVFYFFYFLYRKFIHQNLLQLKKINAFYSLFFLFVTASLIIPIRGGLGEIPIKVSSVYFHKKTYANHAAINAIWNFMYSYTKKDLANAKISFMPDSTANMIFEKLKKDTSKTKKVVNIEKPNILIIALESLSSKIIAHGNTTPFLKKLTKQSVYFSNFYASGDRTDRAMVAILSAYPSYPARNIIMFPHKTESLPFLSKDLKKMGYTNSFYYGGSLNFANYKGFLTNGEFDNLVSIDNFEKKDLNSKWGAHDHVVFNKLLSDLNKRNSKKPFFAFLFTLSSHEPFEVPAKTVITGSSQDSMFLNAAHYADKSLENFIQKAKKTNWWKKTLLIIVADHGTIIPFNTPNYAEKKFKIPMFWLGGALSIGDTNICKYATQSDIAASLLAQLNQKTDNYTYSNNIFSQKKQGYAFYAFNNGFGFMQDSLKLIYDINAGKYIVKKGVRDSLQLEYGKAYLQILSNDFQER